MQFGEKLQQLRKERGLTQEELAEQLGVSRQAVARWETTGIYPEMDNLIRLSDCLGVTVDALVRTAPACAKQVLTAQPSEGLIAFLCTAKRRAYAGGSAEEAFPCRPASHDFVLREEPFTYQDTYLGGEQFAGEEAVWMDKVPVWVMNYAGRILEETFSLNFLKQALREVPNERPFRGPKLLQNGRYVYHCTSNGMFSWFQGKEEIFYDGILVYECRFHGGTIK
jgi:transcriptional regulator with XRE-family HTH domain